MSVTDKQDCNTTQITRNTLMCYRCEKIIQPGESLWIRKGFYRDPFMCNKCAGESPSGKHHCVQCNRAIGHAIGGMGHYGFNEYQPHYHTKNIFCSRRCELDYYSQRDKTNRRPAVSTCQTCGDTFTPKRADSKYCSSKCRQKAYRERKA